MKKITKTVPFLLVLLCLVALTFFPQGAASAQGVTPPTPTGTAPEAAPAAGAEETVSFGLLGFNNTVLEGPYDAFRVRFGTPGTWDLKSGAELVLKVSGSYTREGQLVAAVEGEPIGASLDVTFNGKLLTTLSLEAGVDRIYRVTIPDVALKSPRADGRHDLLLFLNAGIDCDFEYHRTVAMVSAESYFLLPHNLVQPPVDLTILPRPVYQQGSFLPGMATIVVPDQATPAELRAGLITAASLGRMSGGNLPLAMVTSGQLTPEMQSSSDLFFVGKPAGLPALSVATLPGPVSGGKFAAPNAQPEDGVVQIASSPFGKDRVVVVVGGNTDDAVMKAAQALSTGNVQTSGLPTLSLVASVEPRKPPEMILADRTLGDMGYEAQEATGIGIHDLYIRFYIPPGQIVKETPYLDLVFNHSALLNYSRSGMLVIVNGQTVGSARFSDDTTQIKTLRINVPQSVLQPGDNVLDLQVELLGLDVCSSPNVNGLWTKVYPESMLHIPLSPAEVIFAPVHDLSAYPRPFTSDPNLSNLAFVIQPGNPTALNAAGQIAADLGRRMSGSLFELQAAFADNVPAEIREGYNLVVIGMPSKTPILSEMADALPASFEGDVATLAAQQVNYRLPSGISLGHIQLANSPWNQRNTILTVTGTTDEGLGWAGNGLIDPIIRGKLNGNFALINGTQVLTADTRLGFIDGRLIGQPEPTAQPAPQLTPMPVPATAPATQKSWILPAVGVLGALIVIVLIAAIGTAARGKRTSR